MGWGESYAEMIVRQNLQMERRRDIEEAISAALIKIDMMGLTFPECMVECPVPNGIHPSRWRAMIQQALRNGGMPE